MADEGTVTGPGTGGDAGDAPIQGPTPTAKPESTSEKTASPTAPPTIRASGPQGPNRAAAKGPDLRASTTAANEMDKVLKGLVAASAEVSKNFSAMTATTAALMKSLESMGGPLDISKRKFNEIRSDVWRIVDELDNSHAALEGLANVQRKLGREPGFFNGQSRAEVKKFFKEILDSAKALDKSNFGGKQLKALEQHIQDVKDAYDEVDKSKSEALDSAEAQKLSQVMDKNAQSVARLARGLHDVKVDQMNSKFKQTLKIFDSISDSRFKNSHLIKGLSALAHGKNPEKGSFRHKWEEAGEVVHSWRRARKERAAQAYHERGQEIAGTHGVAHRMKVHNILRGQPGAQPSSIDRGAVLRGASARLGLIPKRGTIQEAATSAAAAAPALAGAIKHEDPASKPLIEAADALKAAAAELSESGKGKKKQRGGPKGKTAPTPTSGITSPIEDAEAGPVPIPGGRTATRRGRARMGGSPQGGGAMIGMWDRTGSGASLGAQAQAFTGVTPGVSHVAKSLSDKTGISGWVDKKIANYALSKGAEHLMGGAGLKLLQAGGGSAVRGMGSMVAGAGEGLLGGGMKLLGRAAAPLAIAQAIIGARDMVVEQNKDISKNLAGGGIFAGQGRDVDFNSVRNTLRSTTFSQSTMQGFDYKQNMEIMKSLVEAGQSVADLASKDAEGEPTINLGKALDESKTVQGGGYYGTIMKSAAMGRMSGLGEGQSAQLSIKLMEQFRLTTEETQDFFANLDKNAKRAGISTMKYIDIVENINGQFDSFNQSMRTTTTLLTAVGRTGRLTGDQMKKVMEGLTQGTGANTAQRIVMNRMAFANGGGKDIAQMHAQIISDASSAFNATTEKFRNAGVNIDELDKGGGNMGKIEDQIQKALAGGKIQGNEAKELEQALETFRSTYSRNEAQREAAARGDAVAYSTAQGSVGQNAEQNMQQGMVALTAFAKTFGSKGNSKFSLADMLSADPKRAAAFQQNLAAQEAAGTVFTGEGKEGFQKRVEAMRQLTISNSDFVARTATEGGGKVEDLATTENGQKKIDMLAQVYKTLKPNEAKGKTDRQMAQSLMDIQASGGENGQTLEEMLRANEEFIKIGISNSGALAELNKTARDQAAVQAKMAQMRAHAAETRTSAEIFAGAFEYLFQMLVSKLDFLGKVLNPTNWFKNKNEEKDTKMKSAAIADALGRVDIEGMPEERQKAFEKLRSEFKGGFTTTEELDEKKKQLAAQFPEYAKQMEAGSARGDLNVRISGAKEEYDNRLKQWDKYIAELEEEKRTGKKRSLTWLDKFLPDFENESVDERIASAKAEREKQSKEKSWVSGKAFYGQQAVKDLTSEDTIGAQISGLAKGEGIQIQAAKGGTGTFTATTQDQKDLLNGIIWGLPDALKGMVTATQGANGQVNYTFNNAVMKYVQVPQDSGKNASETAAPAPAAAPPAKAGS